MVKIGKSLFSDTDADVSGKVFVVTGSNSGIGNQIARELAKRKGRVYMACRDLKKCEEAREEIVLESRNKFVYCRQCDLASFSSIRNFVSELSKKEEKVDVLINNAGIMNCRKMYTQDGIEMQLGVNHMGPFLLAHLLKPYLKAAGRSRVVYMMNLDYRKGKINLSDLNAENNYDAAQAFCQSQLATMLSVPVLGDEWRKEGISVNAVYPGVCSTNIKRHMGVDKSITGNLIANPLLWFLTKSAERGAQTPLYVATDKNLENTSGSLFSNLSTLEIDSVALDKELATKVMAVSKYWTGLVDKSELRRTAQ
ncbi:retinol dehydrogenase 13-like [Eurytemora carolleeae]|uniref:retinol dehydrogenase 13-like n=1 Tax=Eurytemora carolleeae TaxID=1294199 RepID=UPI000C77C07A|nr:retinol dehydrogenase 13-like [Eurytemora carolleeae]|eukprot:XP_023335036.1 retinol dehydrogenase 13-like [Eurytemora affinis]